MNVLANFLSNLILTTMFSSASINLLLSLRLFDNDEQDHQSQLAVKNDALVRSTFT